MNDQHQLDLFSQPPAAATRIAASASKPSAATIGSNQPKPITEDMPCLVVDGIRNLTYYVQ
jgi:hypothetical protein